MTFKIAITGGGIGGLAAALALSHGGQQPELFEKAVAFTEIGAGIQLGPNVTRILQNWGVLAALRPLASAPEHLLVRSATTGGILGTLMLGEATAARYGAPYLTLHRADLHSALLQAVKQTGSTLHLNCAVQSFTQTPHKVMLSRQSTQPPTEQPRAQPYDLLVGADGLWSPTRQELLGDGRPATTGHLAFRAIIKQADLPERLRSHNVTAWLGPSMHVVQYPVRGGQWLNVVAFLHGSVLADLQNWDHSANSADLKAALKGSHSGLQDIMDAAPSWRLWVMHDRPPMQSATHMAQGRVALLGDAAHPMRPYLAQGAGMAIEDAAELGAVMRGASAQNIPAAIDRYAAARWQRNARVQARALRNGKIFHATGPLRWGRDVAMRLMGEKLLDMPWLYGFKGSLN